ncbi:amino acid transporter [Desulfitispora alkaliphila]|uniref:APC family permease n=1 Tax=Desulfitispora alkaliphila TaxID=622674 RepID=UPI003D1E8C42
MEQRVELQKSLKPHWVWAIALGSSIGWGSFVLPGNWLADAGTLGAIIGFSIGAVLMMTIAVAYGFMIKTFPVSGGGFSYAYIGFGRNHAFICGWFLTLGYLSIVALNASALSLLFKFTMPSVVERVYLYSVAGWDVYLGEVIVATMALGFAAFINIRGAKASGRSQFYMCMGFLIGVLFLAISLLMHPSTSIAVDAQPLFAPDKSYITAILAIVAIAPWAYVGFDNLPQAAEEFDFSPKMAFMLIILALFFAGLVYSLMILATAVSTPWSVIASGESMWVTGDSIQGLLGIVGLLVLSLSLLMGIGTGLNGFTVSTSRLLFAMGRAKILPEWFVKIHPKYGTPSNGILFTCGLCLIAPWFGREALLWIVDMSATGVTIAYFYCCLVAYKYFRWNNSGVGVVEDRVKPISKLLCLIGTISSAGFFVLLVVPGMPAFLGKQSWIAMGAWILLGITFYLIRHKEYIKIPKEKLDYYVLGDSKNNLDKSI